MLYVGQALKVLAVRQELTALSVSEIRGNAQDGGKGLVDLRVCKKKVKLAAMAKAEALFSHSPATVEWARGEVAQKTVDPCMWARTDMNRADNAWRAGRSPAEIQWLNLMLDLDPCR